MIPDSPFSGPVSSYQTPIPLLSVEPDAEPVEYMAINSAWLALLRGCAKQLLQDSTWRTDDPDDLALALQRANKLIDLLQEQGALAVNPVGTVIMFAGSAMFDPGWLLCHGQAINRVTYSALFSAIGTAYGSGDGTTTFNVPDFQSRVPLAGGSGTGLTTRHRGDTGGEESHVLTVGELPYHQHELWEYAHYSFGTYGESSMAGSDGNGSAGNLNTGPAGSNEAHNTMPPFLVVEFLIWSGHVS